MRPLSAQTNSCSTAAALFELLSATAGTGIVAADFFRSRRKRGVQSGLKLGFGLRQVMPSVKQLHHAVVQFQFLVQGKISRLARRQQISGGRRPGGSRCQFMGGLGMIVVAEGAHVLPRRGFPAGCVFQLEECDANFGDLSRFDCLDSGSPEPAVEILPSRVGQPRADDFGQAQMSQGRPSIPGSSPRLSSPRRARTLFAQSM